MTKPFVVAANWKMHKSPLESAAFLREFFLRFDSEQPTGAATELIFFLPAVNLWASREVLLASRAGWGAQNCYYANKGAFTGETSPAVLSEIGTTHALVGHSERRTLFHESDEDCARKVKALQDVSLTPVLCVGETLKEREAGRTVAVITEQLRAGLSQCDAKKKILIAYEPVWAIGTGKVATAQQANEAHTALRLLLREIVETGQIETPAAQIPILYGGSVKAENAKELASQSEVDGFLIGGASLEIASFLPLCTL